MPTAAAIVGSAVIGGIASNRAADKQVKAQNKAIEAQNELIGPFAQAGTQGLNALQSFVDEGSNFADTQAFKDITNASKAGGQFQSGNRATALTDFFATNFRPQRMAELSFLPTLGANAATGQATNIGNAQTNIGNAQAGGVLGMANAANTGIQGISFLNLLNNQNPTTQGQVTNLLNQPGMF